METKQPDPVATGHYWHPPQEESFGPAVRLLGVAILVAIGATIAWTVAESITAKPVFVEMFSDRDGGTTAARQSLPLPPAS